MNTTLADLVREAAAKGRRLTAAFPALVKRDDLPWKVIEGFDVNVRGHIERDRRIEDHRDQVLIAAVTLAETLADNDPDELDRARRSLVRSIDYLEEAVLRFGFVNRVAARLGYGTAGERVSKASR